MTMWHYRPAAAPAAAVAAAPNADDSEEDDEDDVADIVPMAKPTGSLSDYFFLTIYSRPLSYFFSFTPSPFSPCPWGHHPIFIIYYYSFSYSVVPHSSLFFPEILFLSLCFARFQDLNPEEHQYLQNPWTPVK